MEVVMELVQGDWRWLSDGPHILINARIRNHNGVIPQRLYCYYESTLSLSMTTLNLRSLTTFQTAANVYSSVASYLTCKYPLLGLLVSILYLANRPTDRKETSSITKLTNDSYR
jgi:hypothetical protein